MGPAEVLGYAAAVASMALASWIFWLGPRSALHRILALYLLVVGLNTLLFTIDLANAGVVLTVPSLATRLQQYCRIALPFLAMAAGFEFLDSRGPGFAARTRWMVRGGLAAALALFEALYFWDRSLLYAVDGSSGPLVVFNYAHPAAAAAVACLLLAFTRPNDAATIRVAAAAFLVDGVYNSASIIRQAAGVIFVPGVPINAFDILSFFVLPGLALLAALVAAGLAARMDPKLGRRYLILVVAAMTSSLLVYGLEEMGQASSTGVFGLSFGTEKLFLEQALAFMWGLAATGTLAYAVLRCRFLTAELTARRIFRGSVLAAGIAILFFTAGQVLETKFNPNGIVLNVVAGAVVAVALWPLQRGTTYLAHRLLEHVRDTPDYRKARSEDIYQHAARAAWRDGRISDHEQRALQKLGGGLGLTELQMRRLETRVRAAVASPRTPAASLD